MSDDETKTSEDAAEPSEGDTSSSDDSEGSSGDDSDQDASSEDDSGEGAGGDEPGGSDSTVGGPVEDGGDAPIKDVLDSLDLTRGEVDDRDVKGLADAIDSLDFATRKASKDRLASLRELHARFGDLIEQIARGERTLPEQIAITKDQEARYEELVDQGLEAGRARDLDTASRSLEEAVRLNPEGIDGLFNLGVVYGLLAHQNIAKAEFYDDYTRDEIFMEKARICYDHVLELAPDHLPSLNNLATLYSMRNDKEQATLYLQRILDGPEPTSDVERHIVEEAREHLKELG